eukprot:TRINITY_DN42282_c0_g1_i1.p1 TRINITY_DN42282_c0_g1~~TRINITY_DN42282_c0_g1_i1.p1  ORF type:complete len:331 (+),score=120.83 TRINITY_DN42282_c0_g1_i1:50-1042(+)
MAKIATKGRQVLGDLGNVGGMGGKKGSMQDIKQHDHSGAISPRLENKEKVEPVANPRTDMEARDYVDDIMEHYMKTESLLLPPTTYMSTQPELTPEMRAVCLDWIIECAARFKMAPETLFLTANVLDRFLAIKPIQRKRMQLVSMVSLIIASKYEEIYPPSIKEFIHISADAFAQEDMLRYEHSILHALNYTLTTPTPFSFFSRYLIELKEPGVPESSDSKKLRHATIFLAECAMLNLELYLEHVPSLLGAAAVHAARTITEQEPVWPDCLANICTYSLSDIEELSAKLIKNAKNIKNGQQRDGHSSGPNLQATVKRFAEERRGCVSSLV